MNTAEVEKKVKDAARELAGVMKDAPVKNDENFVDDLNFDSLDEVEFIMALEDEFGIEIPDDDARQIKTVQQAIDYVLTHPKP